MSEKVLVIAEKPSVASDIAKALGGMKREKDYFEGEHYVVSSAVGHLLELAVPEKYDVKRGKWTFANLPVLPPVFDLKPIKKTEDRLKLLKRLLKRADITTVINACDAGREGELIFRYIIQASKCKKTIKRLWLQSMTPAAIREAERQAAVALDSANRWTDNIYTLKSWCVKKFNLPSSTFDKQFGIDESFDYFS